MAEAGMAPLVPDVYAWASATTANVVDEKGFGWIMSELRSGVDLDSKFSFLAPENKKHALEQIAAVLGAIQAASLPEGVTKFGGGLKFDSDGHLVSGESPSMQNVKPAGTYANGELASCVPNSNGPPKAPSFRAGRKMALTPGSKRSWPASAQRKSSVVLMCTESA